ncbi:MAG: hypothetical protein RL346_1565 [Verrucomicrobiota bacterium]|jgi:hypothetical protein
MKYTVTSAFMLIAAVIGAMCFTVFRNKSGSIQISDLYQFPVIGELGVPLGEVAAVQATIVDGDTLRTKEDSGTYRLKITKVNGVELDSQPIMEFSLDHAPDVQLPDNHFSLYRLKNKQEANELSGDQIKELQAGYVGESVDLLVYETGGFSGMPDLPDDTDLWQARGYGFRTHLEVLKKTE